MRYTRYNHKRSSENGVLKFIVSLMVTVIAAGVIGLGLATVIFKIVPTNNINPGVDDNTQQTNSENVNNNSTVVSGNTAFTLIQCGYFSSKDNADQALLKVGNSYGSFIATDGDKYRVVAGIFETSAVQSAIDDLASKGIESVKINIDFNSEDTVQNQIAAISDGYLKILTKTFDENVKAVDTKDFKEWVNSLEEVKDVTGAEPLATLKTYISQLPEEITKEDVSKEMDYLYNLLIKYKQS